MQEGFHWRTVEGWTNHDWPPSWFQQRSHPSWPKYGSWPQNPPRKVNLYSKKIAKSIQEDHNNENYQRQHKKTPGFSSLRLHKTQRKRASLGPKYLIVNNWYIFYLCIQITYFIFMWKILYEYFNLLLKKQFTTQYHAIVSIEYAHPTTLHNIKSKHTKTEWIQH